MKAFILFYIAALTIALTNAAFNIQITKILSPQVASDGYLVLDTAGLKFPLRTKGTRTFSLVVENTSTNESHKLLCYFFQFEHINERETIFACRVNNLPVGTYRLAPSTVDIKISFNFYELFINPFDLRDTFDVTPGKEIYFYDEDDKYEDFDNSRERESIEFDLFEPITFDTQVPMILENKEFSLKVLCYPDDYRLNEIECPLRASDFPQTSRFQTYDVYIEDSQGNKKLNYFVLPVHFNFYYLYNKY